MAHQTQLKREEMLNEAQSIAYNEHMKEVTGHQQQDEKQHDSSLLEKSGEQVRTLAQVAARGAIYMKEGAASFGHGVANAITNNTFGSTKQNKSN